MFLKQNTGRKSLPVPTAYVSQMGFIAEPRKKAYSISDHIWGYLVEVIYWDHILAFQLSFYNKVFRHSEYLM